MSIPISRRPIKRAGSGRRIRPGDLRALGLRHTSSTLCAATSRRKTLKVGLVAHPGNAAAPGGGEVQLLETLRALAQLPVAPRLWRPELDRHEDVDCLHLFGSHPEWLPLVAAARRAGRRVTLSTIAWFDLGSRWHEPASLRHRIRGTLGQGARSLCPWIPSRRRRLYQAVDVLLPNSQAEADQLVRYFGVARNKIRVVPNGARPSFGHAAPEPFATLAGGSGFILCAGRIEPRKNQLALIQALRGHERPLVILGDVVPGQESYAEACRRAAADNVRFLPALAHDDSLLASAYAACGCLVVPSWFETPGLVALEAAMSGTPLVLTDRGATREYFGEQALYVSPGDRQGMRRMIERALAAGRNPLLADQARQRYTWRATAEATYEAYASLL